MKFEEWADATVNGMRVVQVERAETPLSGTGRGGLIYYRKAATLILDGGTTYGCLWDGCDYTSENVTSLVSGHWKVHEVKPDLRRVPFGDLTLNEILGKLTVAEAELASANSARERALEAKEAAGVTIQELRAEVKRLEKELATIKNTFRALAE
jgi:hypothetical protein